MSWEDHTKEMLETNKLSGAVILGKEDGTIYAQSGTPTVTDAEAEAVAKYFNGSCEGASISLAGQKYMLVRAREDIDVAYLVCKGGGVCIAASKTLILVGVWSEKVNDKLNAADCNLVVEKKMDEFLEGDF